MKSRNLRLMIPVYTLLSVCVIAAGFGINKAVTTFSESEEPERLHTIVIDAGHGGIDGGATSCSGVLESQLNLEIALRLNDLMHLLGMDTLMIRTDDRSVYTEGESIAAKKVSDLKQRVSMIEQTDNTVLVSIHQNHYTDAKYSGAQVFYAPTNDSETIAKQMQTSFVQTLNPGSRRQAKKADSIYIMQHITCPGVLVECGFISNAQEEYQLRTPEYQQKVCAVIATQLSMFLYGDTSVS